MDMVELIFLSTNVVAIALLLRIGWQAHQLRILAIRRRSEARFLLIAVGLWTVMVVLDSAFWLFVVFGRSFMPAVMLANPWYRFALAVTNSLIKLVPTVALTYVWHRLLKNE